MGVVLVLGMTIHLFPTMLVTPETLSAFYSEWWPRRDALRQEWRTERAGEGVLPAKVQAMLVLLRENRAQSFRYSDGIARDADTSVVQRLAESTYPIQWSAQAPHLLLLVAEQVPPSCTAVAIRQEVVLANCS
ncbi:MAG: hypothetical protein LH617_00135 [Ramlibacter sp.]|nr:hypothetical protein [Ramlibacter sp.]